MHILNYENHKYSLSFWFAKKIEFDFEKGYFCLEAV